MFTECNRAAEQLLRNQVVFNFWFPVRAAADMCYFRRTSYTHTHALIKFICAQQLTRSVEGFSYFRRFHGCAYI
jgi:hypothetical protein